MEGRGRLQTICKNLLVLVDTRNNTLRLIHNNTQPTQQYTNVNLQYSCNTACKVTKLMQLIQQLITDGVSMQE